MEFVTREELRQKMERGDDFVLVDALSTQNYQSSHLLGAINLPLEFVDEAERVIPDKAAEIIVYCMNPDCAASREEVRELREMGYENVRHYAGGKQHWIKASLPVEGRHASDLYRSTI